MKIVSKVKVKNKLGIHTRPATSIVKLLHQVKSNVTFMHKKEIINAKSILSILMLALHQGDAITITCEGEDAEAVSEKLINAFENCFGET